MLLKTAAYNQMMDRYTNPMYSVTNEAGVADYDPYEDPRFLQELKGGDIARFLGRSAQIGATVGGLGKTLLNLRNSGTPGKLAPILGTIGLSSMILDDYVQ